MSEVLYENHLCETDSRQKNIDRLKALVKDEPFSINFPWKESPYLERYLAGTCYDIEKAFNRIKGNCQLILEHPEWFTKEPPLSKTALIEQDILVALLEIDKEGRSILIAKLGKVDPRKHHLLELAALVDIWLEALLINSTSAKGLCVLVDIAELSWRLLKWLTPHNIKIGLRKLECLPFRDYVFHVVNDSMFVHAAIKIIWPFLPNEIRNMVRFHFNDRESLHAFVDPKVLPVEYGGENKDINYGDLHGYLYNQNDEILESFQLCRTLDTLNKAT